MAAYRGKFKPKHPIKYRGDFKKIIYRSMLEYRLMKYLDNNSKVIWWASEPFPISYISPKDGKPHNYWVDFVTKMKTKDDKIKVLMIEVKPEKQTRQPTMKTRKTKRYINECLTWEINKAKWKSARSVCVKKGWEFIIMTDRILG